MRNRKTIKSILRALSVIILTYFVSVKSIFGQQAELIIPVGHSWDITGIAVSNNMKYMVSCSRDNNIILWDCIQGQMIRKFSVFPDDVKSVCFSKDDKYILASVGADAVIYDIANFEVVKTFKGHKYYINCAIFSPDGKYILTGSRDNTIKLWDFETTELLRTYIGHTREIKSVCFTPDGNNFLSCSFDKSIKYWSVYSILPIRTMEGHTSYITSIDVSPDGAYAVSGGWDKKVIIWNIFNGEKIADFSSHLNWVNDVKFSPDGKYVVSASLYFSEEKDTTVRIFNIAEMKEVTKMFDFNEIHNKVAFSPDGNFLFAEGSNYIIEKWDFNEIKKEISFQGRSNNIKFASFSNDDRCFTATYTVNPQLWDISLASLNKIFGFNVKPPHIPDYSKIQWGIKEVSFVPNSQKVLSAGWSLWLWDAEKEEVIKKISYGKFHSLRFSADQKSFLICDSNKIFIYSLSDYERKLTLNAENELRSADFSPNGKYIVAGFGSYLGSTKNGVIMWNINDGGIIKGKFKESNEVVDVCFSPDGSHLVTAGADLILWDVRSGRKIHKFKEHNSSWKTHLKYTSDGKYLLVGGGFGLSLYDMKDFSEIIKYEGIAGYMQSLSLNSKNNRILGCSSEGTVIYWDISQKQPIVTFVPVGFYDNFSITPDQYYFTSKRSLSKLSYRVNGLDVYPVEQFDLQFNRPDIVLQRIGLADTSLITAYHLAYLKRLKKMRFTEEMFSTDFHVPEVFILNNDSLPISTNLNNTSLKVNAFDRKYKLNRINVWVNDVPVFGIDGIDLRSFQTDSVIKEIPIELSQGKNNIQVSCLNEKGVESYKETVRINYLPEVPVIPVKYIVAISVSDYKDVRYNLKYAVEDGRDMATMFAGKYCFIDTLFNQNATRDSILALKQKLMQTKVDDEVILYVSGHGLLDKNYDFYFATYDMDFSDPAKRGVLYDDLEGLLDGIPARKKLLLMDACHSGEVDKDEIVEVKEQKELADGSRGQIKTYGYKGTIIDENQNTKLGLQNSFELMQELFANLSRGSGAVVISAASGVGYALESADWKNGVFTYSILNGLKSNNGKLPADANKDGQVTVSELKDYVSAEVERLTNGAQKPTSRRESLEFDWRVW